MSYKNILVHLDDGNACPGRVQAATRLARAHDAHLTGLYVAVDPYLPGNLSAETPPELLRTLEDQFEERLDSAKTRFTETMARDGLTADCRTVHCPGTRVPEVIELHGRYADLIVLGQPQPEDPAGMNGHVAENVVLSSGRPALVVPYIGPRRTLGERILIAWDGGREAARAVTDALPLLERAKTVTVLVINPAKGNHGAEPGADIALYLARHGITVQAGHIVVEGISVADTLLSRLADKNVDLLVMGAYGHSRLRELVLGGVTRQIFQQMTVPVLMSH